MDEDETPQNWKLGAPVFADEHDKRMWEKSKGELKGYNLARYGPSEVQLTAWDRTVDKYLHILFFKLKKAGWWGRIVIEPCDLEEFDHFRPIVEEMAAKDALDIDFAITVLSNHGFLSWQEIWELKTAEESETRSHIDDSHPP